jgi:hypothetical protein
MVLSDVMSSTARAVVSEKLASKVMFPLNYFSKTLRIAARYLLTWMKFV